MSPGYIGASVAMQKSTKEIAREVVEAEFQRAGKRRKRKVDSSDDEDDKTRKSRHLKSETFGEPKPASSSELERLSAKYRDRVKERREGVKLEDGDAVRFSVEDQLFNDVVSALESGNRQKLALISRPTDGIRVPATFEEAIAFIADPESNPPRTKLGIDVLSFLQKAYLAVKMDAVRVSAAGRNVQQSVWTYTMAINADPRDRARSWELPVEQTFASTSHPDSDESVIEKACLCSPQLLRQMLDFFSKRAKKQERIEHPDVSPIVKVVGDSVDDDDDIFENVGEYDVYGSQEGDDAKEIQLEKLPSKGSIFGIANVEREKDQHLDPAPMSMEANNGSLVINRPGAHKLSSLGPLEHDDDVELDFDGRDYDDDDNKKLDKHKEGDITRKHKKRNKGMQRNI